MELANSINWLAVVAAAVANMVIGALWYMPALFGDRWMRYTGLTREAIESAPNMWVSYLGALVGSLVLATAVALIAGYAAAGSFVDGLVLLLVFWVGLFVTSLSDEALWERRPVGLYILNCGRWLVALTAVTLIVVLWV